MKTIMIILLILLSSCSDRKQVPPKVEWQVLTIQGDTLNLNRSPFDGHLYLIKQ